MAQSQTENSMMGSLTRNIAHGLPIPENADPTTVLTCKGDYDYYHYGCDGFDDRGWGCGYRTLQTLCSWVRFRQKSVRRPPVPSIVQIQEALVRMEDKPHSFVKSKQWIGSVEVALVVDYFYNVPCKIVTMNSGSELPSKMKEIEQHFKSSQAPIMMGGDGDAASKGILGVCCSPTTHYLLILDPHYFGEQPNQDTLVNKDMLIWRPLDTFMKHSIYNLCLPQYRDPS